MKIAAACFQDMGMTFIDVSAVLMWLLELNSDPNLYAAGYVGDLCGCVPVAG